MSDRDESRAGTGGRANEGLGGESKGAPRDASTDRDRAQELPEREAHKLNHGDKYEPMIPRGTDEESDARSGDREG